MVAVGWFERTVVAPGKLPLLLALVAFVVGFGAARTVTRLIRAGRGPFHDISSRGGTHIHHAVPGVVLMLAGGFGALTPTGVPMAREVGAVVFGVGAGLVLDEFALLLYLQDVYWTEQGRRSVEAAMVTAALVALALAGVTPFGIDEMSAAERRNRTLVTGVVAGDFLLVVTVLLKGKPRTALLGVFVPVAALVGAVRLARPDSPWARLLYRRRPRAQARARARARRYDARWRATGRRVQDLVGGRPDGDGPQS